MTRETKELEVAGHKIVMNSYLTGRESNAVKAMLFQGVTLVAEAGEKPTIPLANIIPQERKTLELLLVSVDGITENPVGVLEDLPADQYDEAVAAVKAASKAFLGQTK